MYISVVINKHVSSDLHVIVAVSLACCNKYKAGLDVDCENRGTFQLVKHSRSGINKDWGETEGA